MRGLVPRIHVFRGTTKTWMAGATPGLDPGAAVTVCDSNGAESVLVAIFLPFTDARLERGQQHAIRGADKGKRAQRSLIVFARELGGDSLIASILLRAGDLR